MLLTKDMYSNISTILNLKVYIAITWIYKFKYTLLIIYKAYHKQIFSSEA